MSMSIFIINYLKSMFKKIVHYLNSAPVSCSDLWIWLCLTLSCLVLTYLNLRALMLLIGQFVFIFILIEGVSTRFDWNNYKWNFKLNMLRLMVSIPIYMSIYGTILLIQEMIFIVPTDLSDTIIFVFNSILMAPMVYSILNTSYRFILHRTIPRRWELLVCTFALYWTTLGKIIYSVIRRGPRPPSVISYMLPKKTDQPNKSSLGWTLHEKIREAFEDRIEKSRVGEQTGEASGPSDIQSRNLQAAADRVVRDCGRIVCKAVQSITKKQDQKEAPSPKSPSQSPFNPFQ